MKIIDLSQVVSETSLFYPGDPGVELTQVESMEKGASNNGEVIKAGVHSLTHIDAPGHQIKDGETLDSYPLKKFVQQALLIKILGVTEIKKEDLEPYQDKIKQAGALLIRTGFDKIIERYEQNADFRKNSKISVNDLPRFTQDCAEWLSDFGNLELVGVDSLTVGNKIIHSAFLEKDILLVEGLFLEGLSQASPQNFILYCLPWKIKNVNGAPCRAIALI
ncbi:MAG: cyclase family protein [Candidatus Nealsonbacteria bacterium]